MSPSSRDDKASTYNGEPDCERSIPRCRAKAVVRVDGKWLCGKHWNLETK